MKILIHAISTKMGGAKRHLDNLLMHLDNDDSANEYYIVVNDEYTLMEEYRKMNIVPFSMKYSNGVKRVIFDNWHINKLIKKYHIELLVSFANFGPIMVSCKHVLFETNALYFCDNIKNQYNWKQKLDFTLKRYLIKWSALGADLIITPSMSLKSQLVHALSINKSKIDVLYHAIESNFNEDIKDRENNDTVQFLYPSHLARHKGINILLEALIIFKKQYTNFPKFNIICTFSMEDDTIYYKELMTSIYENGLSEIIQFIGTIPQSEISQYYAKADYMIYTSLCESFGFSMLEAKVFHLPAICSDIEINQEIAKHAAKYYPSDNPEALSTMIHQFITQKPTDFEFHDELLYWDWDKYTRKFLDIIDKV
jgi:glycosyltransferase involved in cell wall biosynthesis